MKLLREIVYLFKYLWKTSKKEKNIIFYAEHEGYYPNYEGIIKEITEKNQETICYFTSSLKDPILNNNNLRIKVFYFNSLLPFLMILIRCKVFVMTLTDLNKFHLKRSINTVHYTYVFHAMVSTHMMYLEGAFDHYDSILCIGSQQINEIRKYEELHKLSKKQLIEAGYYRLERIYNKYQKFISKDSAAQKELTVLIAPSWGVGNVLESYGEQLVTKLLEKGYKVIVRPHPETVRRSGEMLDKLESQFVKNPAFLLERSVSTDDSLLKSDVLICDCSGVALEYAFGTERPVLFLEVPYKIRNKNYKELCIEPFELSIRAKIGVVVSPDELNDIPQHIKDLLENNTKYKKVITELREQNIYNFGYSSVIGAKHIVDLANKTENTV